MPSVSDKEQRFMGRELGRKRAGLSTQTSMSEDQQGDFARNVKKHGSLNDIEFHEEADSFVGDRICPEFIHPIHKGYDSCTPGQLDPPVMDVQGAKPFTKGKQSCNRDVGQGLHYGAPVEYFGPDTDYRAEEIDTYQYGKDYDPYPLQDYFKTEVPMSQRTFRVRSQDLYDETATPGTVTDKQPMSEAHGAVNYRGAGPNTADGSEAGSDRYRTFDNQRRYARSNKDRSEEFAIDVDGLDTRRGKDIK